MSKISTLKNQLVEARKQSLSALSDISHRLEKIAEVNGITYINDSKSTDMESTLYSLENIKQPIVWIVGSSDTEQHVELVEREVKLKVKSVISFGNFSNELSKKLTPITDSYTHFITLENAIKKASELASSGDVVLFSPANSSFELYESYRERGNHFKEIVNTIS
ncbi:MAG: glutamate ligase domain-containing protein [Bacteroidia bacterium]